jgi:hypothetical protein
MNDASGEHVEAHAEAVEAETRELQHVMDNDRAHLDPR